MPKGKRTIQLELWPKRGNEYRQSYPMTDEEKEKFYSYSWDKDGHTLWSGSISKKRNPVYWHRGLRKLLSAKRIVWSMHEGAIPGNKDVVSSCGNKRCIYIGHLVLVPKTRGIHGRFKYG